MIKIKEDINTIDEEDFRYGYAITTIITDKQYRENPRDIECKDVENAVVNYAKTQGYRLDFAHCSISMDYYEEEDGWDYDNDEHAVRISWLEATGYFNIEFSSDKIIPYDTLSEIVEEAVWKLNLEGDGYFDGDYDVHEAYFYDGDKSGILITDKIKW